MADNRIRVAQVIGRVSTGGIEAIIANLYKNIDHDKVVFDFFVQNTCVLFDEKEIESHGGHLYIIPSYRKYFKFKKTLRKLFKENHYDIAHINMNTLSFISAKEAKKAGIKVRIVHSHSTSNKKEFLHHVVKHLLRPFSKRHATHFFACSEYAGRWMYGDKTFDSSKVHIINNGVDFSRFAFDNVKRNQIRKELNIPENAKVIGHIGRFEPQKNHPFFFDVYEKLLELDKDYYLLLIGRGVNLEPLKERIKEHHLDKVIILETTGRPEDYYQAMDCFALPSLYEGLPVVGVEAQANGLKCFFSGEVTREAKFIPSTEFVSIRHGVEPWVNSISEFFKNNKLREEGNVDESFNIKNVSKKLLSLYQGFLKEDENKN